MSHNSGISGQASSFIPGTGGGAPFQQQGHKSGEITFPGDAMAVPKKTDALRPERNNKRAERREKGEKDVSDDEGDELSGFMMGAPSGENPAHVNHTVVVVPKSTEMTGSDAELLFSDEAAAHYTFHANDMSIPTAIRSLAKNGISPPLNLFLAASLEHIRSSNVKTVKHGTGETTKVTVIDLSDFPAEEILDQATWLTCYNGFLMFLETSAGPLIFQSFARHYNQLLSDPDLSD
ncbi:hypothetical protein B0H19DRAFT_1296093 [Mycena capillaripes]|nr:hypothetical protein B0H19DRAFT_1296093 [Mycena capillaripes]